MEISFFSVKTDKFSEDAKTALITDFNLFTFLNNLYFPLIFYCHFGCFTVTYGLAVF